MTELERRIIKVSEVEIENLRYDDNQRFFVLTANAYNESGVLVEEEQRLLRTIISSDWEANELQKRIVDHLENIKDIQNISGGRLDEVRLLKMSIEDAEALGYLNTIGYLEHIPTT